MTVVVSRVTPDDWERLRSARLAALAESPEMFASTLAREEAFDEAEWRRRTERPTSYLAVLDGRDVGVAGVFTIDGAFWIMAMWVDPAARGRGVVDALIDACVEEARQHSAVRVHLWVMADNRRGIRAYRRAGFTLRPDRQHLPDGREEILMVRELR